MMAHPVVATGPSSRDPGDASADIVFSAGGIGDMIVDAIERHALRTAFVCRDRPVSYREVGEQISRALQQFARLGLKPGEVVMQLTGNRHEMFIVMAAAFIGGYVSVVPNSSASLDDHRYMLEDCGAALLIVDAERAGRARQLVQASSRIVRVASHDPDTIFDDFWQHAAAFEPARLRALDRPGDTVRLIYTGGTTGVPKGVMTPSRALAFASLLHISEQSPDTSTRLLVSSPMSHGAGALVVPVLVKGGCVVVHDGFDAERVLAAIEAGNANLLFVVPTMLYKLMDHPRLAEADLSHLKRILYTASPISETRLAQALALFGPILHQNYGQTEVPGTILSLTPEDHVDPRGNRLTSAGKPYPCVRVTLLADTGEVVTRGDIGELCVRAPHVTPGYWNKPEATAELLRDGWLHTGDMAYQDDDGYFHIVDRKKDMIISGGFNVYPQEIESVIGAHPAVAAVAVIGVPDPTWGEAVKAIVVPRAGMPVDPDELVALVKARKGSKMAPKSIDLIGELPLTPLGKIDKKALRAPFWLDHSKAVN